MGRPTDNPKETMFRVRLDKTSETELEAAAEKLELSKSEVVRKGIHLVYDSLDEK